MNKLGSLVVAIALAACGGGTKQPAAQTTPASVATPAPAATGAVEVGELKFYEGDDMGLQLHANGHLEVKMTHSEAGKPPQEMWHDVGAIGTDGAITGSDGKKQAEIKPDGSLVTPDGQAAPFHLDGETLVIADKKITIDDKGILQGGNDMGKPVRIEGATTPGLKRTALIVLALVMASGPGDEHAAPAPAGH